MNEREIITLTLEDGSTIAAEVRRVEGEEDIASRIYDIEVISSTLRSVSETLSGAIAELEPTKVSVEFGLELAVESGRLTSLIVSGTGTSNLKINLEWDRSNRSS